MCRVPTVKMKRRKKKMQVHKRKLCRNKRAQAKNTRPGTRPGTQFWEFCGTSTDGPGPAITFRKIITPRSAGYSGGEKPLGKFAELNGVLDNQPYKS